MENHRSSFNLKGLGHEMDILAKMDCPKSEYSTMFCDEIFYFLFSMWLGLDLIGEIILVLVFCKIS
jgi:hypothetical protein